MKTNSNTYWDKRYTLYFFSCFAIVKKKLLPFPTSDSNQIFPPIDSIAFLVIAKPKPVPGMSFFVCNRLKIINTVFIQSKIFVSKQNKSIHFSFI